jgi:hypothetical protein
MECFIGYLEINSEPFRSQQTNTIRLEQPRFAIEEESLSTQAAITLKDAMAATAKLG